MIAEADKRMYNQKIKDINNVYNKGHNYEKFH
jgi:hypothetical protein